MTLGGNLATEQRLEWLRARLADAGRVRTKVAADALGVSEMTIRRDLLEMEALGEVRRVRGGAAAVGGVSVAGGREGVLVGGLAFADRRRQRAHAKARISAKILPLVPETGAIAIDASSTLQRLAASIPGARDLTVITNGPATFEALQGKAGVHPVLTGGQLEARTGSLIGPVAVRAASTFLVSHFFTSAAAVDEHIGASEAALQEAEVKQVLTRVASRVVLAVDGSKLGTRAVASSLSWDDIDLMVTELDPLSPRLTPYRKVTKLE